MSEVSSSAPGQRPPPTNTGGPGAVTKPNPAHDQPKGEQQAADQKSGDQTPAQQSSKSYYDPAVSVSPALAHIGIGQKIEGHVVAVDAEGRPVLRTEEGTFALRPDAGLQEGNKVVIRVTESDKKLQGDLIVRDGRRIEPPVALQLTLIGIHPEPEEIDPAQTPKETGQKTEFSYGRTVAASVPNRVVDYESSTLSLPRSDPAPAEPAAGRPPQPTNTTTIKAEQQAITGFLTIPAPAIGPDHLTPPVTGGAPPHTAPLTPPPQTGAKIAPPAVSATLTIPKTLILPDVSFPGVVLVAVDAPKDGPVFPPFKTGDPVRLQIITPDTPDFTPGTEPVIVQAVIIPPAASPVRAPDGGQILQTPIGHVAIKTPSPLPANQILTIAIRPAETPGAQIQQSSADATAPADFGPTQRPDTQRQTPITPERADRLTTADSSVLTASPQERNNPSGLPTANASVSVTQPADSQPTIATSVPQPAATVPPIPSPPPQAMAEDWPILEDFHTALTAIPSATAGALMQRIPRLDAKLPNTLLFLTQALKLGSFQQWAGTVTTDALEKAGHENLVARLEEEFSKVGRLFAEPQTDGWRPLPIPLQTDQGLTLLAAIVRPIFEQETDHDRHKGSDPEDGKKAGSRFLLEFDLAALGTLQLDGLIKGAHFDLVFRSHDAISEPARRDMQHLFHTALVANDMEGSLTFEQRDNFPVIVTSLLTKIHHSDHHENVTI